MRELLIRQDNKGTAAEQAQTGNAPAEETGEAVAVPVNRLGTVHRIETLRRAGVLDRSYETVVDIGGYDGTICSRIEANERIVVEPFPPEPSLRAGNVRFCQSDGSKVPLDSESADLVLLLDVLEHVEKPSELIGEAVRLLKPEGRGVITVPSKDIRIFPWFLQGWADRRWDHTIRRGYRPEVLWKEISENSGECLRTLDMGCTGFRITYLPMSMLWRTWQGAAHKLLAAISRFDYRFQSLGSGRGYIFIEFRRTA